MRKHIYFNDNNNDDDDFVRKKSIWPVNRPNYLHFFSLSKQKKCNVRIFMSHKTAIKCRNTDAENDAPHSRTHTHNCTPTTPTTNDDYINLIGITPVLKM